MLSNIQENVKDVYKPSDELEGMSSKLLWRSWSKKWKQKLGKKVSCVRKRFLEENEKFILI